MSAPISIVEKPPSDASLQGSKGDRQECNGKLANELERNGDKRPRATTAGHSGSNDSNITLDAQSCPDESSGKTSDNNSRISENMDTSSNEKAALTTIRRPSTTANGAITTTTTTTTTSASKFKEKRPEPLKLNPSLNQDIPLDLSVKSAGNVPSGTMSNIFNLGPTSHQTTLETPRIQWQDNDALLAAGTNTRTSSSMPHSASLILESPSTCELQRAQLLDRWSQSSRTQINQLRNELLNGTRRSCSTDNLKFHTGADRQQVKNDKQHQNRLKVNQDDPANRGSFNNTKKNAISPLAMKSLSNTQNDNVLQNKFSYTNQQIASNLQETQRSPTTNANIDGKSLTPTSVANATANLLNIHLTSPTGLSQSPIASTFDVTSGNNNHSQRSPYKSPSFSSFEHDLSPLDPHISATYCQQQNNSRTSSITFSSPTLSSDPSSNYHRNMLALQQQQQQSFASISSTATLNTPTLISPSQLKAGHLCFLQSPTLSPISSVFDLPSPFLMFPPSAQNQQQAVAANKQISPRTIGSSQLINDKPNADEMLFEVPSHKNSTNISKSCDTLKSSGSSINVPPKTAVLTNISSTNDLSHLITSVTKKTITPAQAVPRQPAANHTNVCDDVDMEIDTDLKQNQDTKSGTELKGDTARPATVIPQICVSDHHPGGSYQHASKFVCIADEQPACKSPTSPKLFCVKTEHDRAERSESSSAPPYVDQRRARSKVKTIAADSCFDIALKNHKVCKPGANEVGNVQTRHDSAQVQASTNHQQNRTWRPYPEIRSWFPSAGNLLQAQSYTDGSNSTLGVRSNSAEPTIYSGALPNKRANEYSPSITNSNNATLNCCQHVAPHHNNGVSQSNSAQQLHYSSLSDANSTQDINSLNRTIAAGLGRSHMNSIHPNQQFQQQYASSHAYFQHQNHLQSTSAGDLDRIANVSSHQGPLIVSANSYDAGSRQNFGHFNQPHASQSQFMRQNQLNHPGISSSLNRVDHLLNEYHQVQSDQKRHLVGNAACIDQMSMPHQPPHQTSVINLLCTNEICKRQMPTANEPHKASAAGALTAAQHRDLIADVISMNHATNSNSTSNNLNCAYQIDIESRSDSRSSSSLDYSSQFMDGGSRANSEAGSNMTSKKYHCDQCSKSFTRSDMLTRHRRLHSGDRPFQCSECKQEFSRSDHLSTHMRTHTGEKPYKCKLCSYSACRKDMITRHLKVHSRNPHSNDCL